MYVHLTERYPSTSVTQVNPITGAALPAKVEKVKRVRVKNTTPAKKKPQAK